MAKVSPVSIKYMVHASLIAEGALEKPDVIGAIFGQTEGLLGAELEMRELQKEGKIGRIEVELERKDKRTYGKIKIPTALDQSETTLIAAAIETIERVGPSDAQIEVDRIEDVRGSKRDYIIERAKKLMKEIEGSTDSREISNEIKDSSRMADVLEYGESKLPYGTLDDKELIVVEGRADVLNLMRNGINNCIAMNGTKLPEEIKELSKEKEITLFVDGDRGGKLIVKNVADNAEVKYVATAPDGKEVEELTGKEILMNLRKKLSLDDFMYRENRYGNFKGADKRSASSHFNIEEIDKEKLSKINDKNKKTGKAIFLDENLEELKKVSAKGLGVALNRGHEKPVVVVVDGNITNATLKSCEEAGVKVVVASNFSATSDKIKLMCL